MNTKIKKYKGWEILRAIEEGEIENGQVFLDEKGKREFVVENGFLKSEKTEWVEYQRCVNELDRKVYNRKAYTGTKEPVVKWLTLTQNELMQISFIKKEHFYVWNTFRKLNNAGIEHDDVINYLRALGYSVLPF